MRRDLNLVREILLRLEPLSADFNNTIPLTVGEPPLDIPGYSKEQIGYHLLIMAQGGLIQHSGMQSDNAFIPHFGGLRWLGHEFVDDVRNPEAWKSTQDKMQKYGSVGFEMAWELAKAYLRTHGLPL
jgi:Hypothetical protein (DUF2513)